MYIVLIASMTSAKVLMVQSSPERSRGQLWRKMWPKRCRAQVERVLYWLIPGTGRKSRRREETGQNL